MENTSKDQVEEETLILNGKIFFFPFSSFYNHFIFKNLSDHKCLFVFNITSH